MKYWSTSFRMNDLIGALSLLCILSTANNAGVNNYHPQHTNQKNQTNL
jgi:hypothetical protein